MPWMDVFWDDAIESYISMHGLSYADIEHVICHPTGEDQSDSTGRPIRFGLAIDGRKIAVVYELIDSITVYPITAYQVR